MPSALDCGEAGESFSGLAVFVFDETTPREVGGFFLPVLQKKDRRLCDDISSIGTIGPTSASRMANGMRTTNDGHEAADNCREVPVPVMTNSL